MVRADPAQAERRRRWLVVGLSLALAGAAVWLLRAGALPVVPPRSAFATVAWWTLPGYAAVWLGILFLRSYRWKWLLAPVAEVPVARVLAVSLISCGALIVLPARMGEAVRPALIRGRQPSGTELSAWEAAGTVGAERIFDGLFMTVLVLAAMLAARPQEPLPDRVGDLPVPVALVSRATEGALFVFAAAFVLMIAAYFARERARRATLAVFGLAGARVGSFAAAKIDRVVAGLGILPRADLLGPFSLMTLAYWLLNAAGVWLVCLGSAVPVSLPAAMVLIGVLGLGGLLPNAPGLFGAFQLSLYAGFALYLPADQIAERASAAIFLVYLVQIAGTLIMAGVGLVWLRWLDAALAR